MDRSDPDVDAVVARLAAQGVRLEPADAEALLPALISLLRRLARLADELPEESPPQPGGGERFHR